MSVRVRLCVLWNYICEFWDRHLKKPIIPFWCRLSLRHRRTAQKKCQLKKKEKKTLLVCGCDRCCLQGGGTRTVHSFTDWMTERRCLMPLMCHIMSSCPYSQQDLKGTVCPKRKILLLSCPPQNRPKQATKNISGASQQKNTQCSPQQLNTLLKLFKSVFETLRSWIGLKRDFGF